MLAFAGARDAIGAAEVDLALDFTSDGGATADDVLRLSREAARWRGTPEEQWPTVPRPGAVYIRVAPKRLISWDYARP